MHSYMREFASTLEQFVFVYGNFIFCIVYIGKTILFAMHTFKENTCVCDVSVYTYIYICNDEWYFFPIHIKIKVHLLCVCVFFRTKLGCGIAAVNDIWHLSFYSQHICRPLMLSMCALILLVCINWTYILFDGDY